MPQETAYTQSAETLVGRLVQAAARSGAANSGSCIDVMGDIYAMDAIYLQGAVLARLEGKQSPFEPDTVVVPKRVPHSSRNFRGSIYEKDPLTINRVFYVHKRWYLEFQKHEELYDASNYEPAPVAAVTAT